MKHQTFELKSFETLYFESIKLTPPSSINKKRLFAGGVRQIDFFSDKLNCKVLQYSALGDAGFEGTQYFTSNANDLALFLFHENPYGQYWDELYQILKGTAGAERDALTAEYTKECMPKMVAEDHDTATKIFESLGGHECIALSIIVSNMVSLQTQGDAANFWSSVLNQSDGLVTPVAFRSWSGNERTLLCKCTDSFLLISFVTS